MPRLTTNGYCLNALRRNEYHCAVVEKWLPYKGGKENADFKLRKDFGGFADILAWHPSFLGVLAIQTCAHSTAAAHAKKVLEDPKVQDKILDWLSASNRFEIWGWKKAVNARGRKAMCLYPRRCALEEIALPPSQRSISSEVTSITFLLNQTELPDWQLARG